ncbi:hypothetical protein [Novosphingobium sp.]|uniref:DUF7940 domain-containing protein n=1 Tax=Novosphingobium sp. TaxID=1874826 RepID=UPI0031D5B00A
MICKRLSLVDEARHWWRLWTIRFYALIGLAVPPVVNHPEIVTSLVAYVPAYWRPAAVSAAAIIVFAICPAVLRLLKQRLPDAR